MRRALHWVVWTAALLALAACGDDESESGSPSGGSGGVEDAGTGGSGGSTGGSGGSTGGSGGSTGGSGGSTGGSGGSTGGSGGSTGGSAGTAGEAGTGGAAGADAGAPQPIDEWVVEMGYFAFVHGNYGKGSYCGAFEMGAIPGFEDVRCTDTGTYVFAIDQNGNLRMEEAVYVYKISEPDPDGTFPWFVDGGYSGSVFWKLTPTSPALDGVDPSEAMEFDVVVDGGVGNDPFWEWLGSQDTQFRLILARGEAEDSLLEWTTADYNSETSAWVERDTGDLFPGWFIELYPEGAFYAVECADGDRVAGATVADGDGGTFQTGPGYCAPRCRGATTEDPNGANGLPVCAGADLAERPRADALLPTP